MRSQKSCIVRYCDWLAISWVALVVSILCYRVVLPNNRHRDLDIYAPPAQGEMTAQTTNGYEDVVSIVTAHNFARDGFLRTHLLPNRRGAPLVSYFDFSRTQCDSIAASNQPLVYPNFWEQPTPMLSLRNDCIYTHYPPFADWVFGAMASLGLHSVLDYKLLAVLLNGCMLLALYAWLRREVAAGAALASLVVVASCPAFFEWASALYYHPFQYLFLATGMLCWSLFLEGRKRRWFVLTGLLFFCEALVSYDLIVFFGIALLGLLWLDRRELSRAQCGKLLAKQAAAPLLATLLHFGLRLSLFGIARTWSNIRVTAHSRITEGIEAWRVQLWFNRVHFKLAPLELLALATVLVVIVRVMEKADVHRAVVLLATLLIGAMSFACIFPGTAAVHTWMMYRHCLPFFAVLTAFVSDALWRAGRLTLSNRRTRSGYAGLALICAVGCGVPLGWSLWRSAKAIAADILWNVAANRHHDARNIAMRFLDALYWRERNPQTYSVRILTPLDGHRVDEPAHPSPGFIIDPGVVSHYEIWWLDEVKLGSVSLLTDRLFAVALASSCNLSFFDGDTFQAPHPVSPVTLVEFSPSRGEPVTHAYQWVRFCPAVQSRALRLTCTGLAPIPLHHVEVL